MTEIGLLGALGTTGALVAFLFWQAWRAARSADGELAATKRTSELELQLAARGRAVEERDRIIDAISKERENLRVTLAEALAQRDALVNNIKDPHAAVTAMRDALPHGDGGGSSVPVP